MKSLILRVTAPGQLKVTCPPRLAQRQLIDFVMSRKDWIENQHQILKSQAAWRERGGQIGETYLFLGQNYKLRDGMTFLKRPLVEFEGGDLWFHWPEKQFARREDPELRPMVQKLVLRKLRAESERLLTERLIHYAKEMNVQPKELSFRNQKARWGSCSSRGAISLNRKLIGAPLEVLDSVIVHELCHLVHMNHSAAFWALVEKYSPEHKQADRWLSENAHRLLPV